MATPKKTPKEANLKPAWKKGESGNPNGRKKGSKNWSTIYRGALKRYAEDKGLDPESIEYELAQKAIERAMKDQRTFEYLNDKEYGKPKQAVEMTGEDGGPIETSLTIKFE